MEFSPEQWLSHYRLIEKIGQGGMGVVWRAEDARLHRQVALKFLLPDLLPDREGRKRFAREAQAAGSLMHPNIATVFAFEEVGGQTFMVMEFVDGETLAERLKRGSLTDEQAVEIAVSIADALSLAHRRGIVHRDLKPANVMLCAEPVAVRTGVVKVMDFGVAKLKGTAAITSAMMLVGTLSYMSPEQVSGKPVDHRSDIFSFGVVFYEMLTGRRPFEGHDSAAVLYGIVHKPRPPLGDLRADHLEALERIIAKCLEKDPVNRYQTMVELLADLAVYQYEPQTLASKSGGGRKSLLVFPFEDISAGKDNAHLADGLTEELITALSRSKQLRVMARSSALQYKGCAKDVSEIGKELGVGYVLAGSIRRHDEVLRVATRLIDTSDGCLVWADRFDGVMGDIFTFEETVAGRVAAALDIELGGSGEITVTRPVPQTGAYEQYLLGRLLLDAPTLDNLTMAEAALRQALKIDPHYAAARGALAACCLWYVDTGVRPDPVYLSRAREQVEMALRLDARQPDAIYARSNLALKAGSPDDAYAGFSRVLELDPSHRNAHLWRTVLLQYSSYFEESLLEANRLLARDPFWPMAHWLHSTIRLHQGMFDVALSEYERVAADVPSKLVWLGLAYRYAGRMDRAWDAAQRLREIEPEGLLWHMAFALLEGAEGKGKEILRHVDDRVREYSWDFIITVYWVASIYALAGEADEGFHWLERGIEIGNRNHRWFSFDPNLKRLREDPRFARVLSKARGEAARTRPPV